MLDTNLVTSFVWDIFQMHGLSKEIVWSQLKICEPILNYFILKCIAFNSKWALFIMQKQMHK
jgi:hypothetical protein